VRSGCSATNCRTSPRDAAKDPLHPPNLAGLTLPFRRWSLRKADHRADTTPHRGIPPFSVRAPSSRRPLTTRVRKSSNTASHPYWLLSSGEKILKFRFRSYGNPLQNQSLSGNAAKTSLRRLSNLHRMVWLPVSQRPQTETYSRSMLRQHAAPRSQPCQVRRGPREAE